MQELSVLKAPQCLDSLRSIILDAALVAVDSLRSKLGAMAWTMLKYAYRELSFVKDVDTSAWIAHSLMLQPVCSDVPVVIDAWVRKKAEEGQLIAKDGFVDRWMIKR